jgi:anti-sigma B factor antagonist
MAIQRIETGGVHVLSCTGELALGKGVSDLLPVLQESLDAGARRIVLDLVRLAWMDSSGVGAIVACSKRAADRAAILCVAAAPDGPVKRILLVTHLHRVFDIFDDVESAVKSFSA